ncbi:MAG: response regulator transcription factor [Myxococcota bacterium]
MDSRRTILIVDDVPMFRELESVFLARCGRVVTGCNGAEALTLAERELPDIVVIDDCLPDLPGHEVCRRLKASPGFEETPIIVITRAGSAIEHAKAVRSGADDVLSKPISRLALVETVQRFIRFSAPRGLPRVTVDTPVHLVSPDTDSWGVARNVSRGGMFIEMSSDFDSEKELRAEFELPEAAEAFSRTVRVVWQRSQWRELPAGLGVRFVDLDAPDARRLDDYVHERALPGGWAAPREIEEAAG